MVIFEIIKNVTIILSLSAVLLFTLSILLDNSYLVKIKSKIEDQWFVLDGYNEVTHSNAIRIIIQLYLKNFKKAALKLFVFGVLAAFSLTTLNYVYRGGREDAQALLHLSDQLANKVPLFLISSSSKLLDRSSTRNDELGCIRDEVGVFALDFYSFSLAYGKKLNTYVKNSLLSVPYTMTVLSIFHLFLTSLIVMPLAYGYLFISLSITIRLVVVANHMIKSAWTALVVDFIVILFLPIIIIGFINTVAGLPLMYFWMDIYSVIYILEDPNFISLLIIYTFVEIFAVFHFNIITAGIFNIEGPDVLGFIVMSFVLSALSALNMIKAAFGSAIGLVSLDFSTSTYSQAIFNWAIAADIMFSVSFVMLNIFFILIKRSNMFRRGLSNLIDNVTSMKTNPLSVIMPFLKK